MHFSLETLALQIANVLVLIWLLNRYVLKPLGARLTERRKVLAEKLFEIATKTTAKGFFAGAELIDIEPRPDDPKAAPPMSQKSMTLSAQCK